jgi:hypothetical protein
MPSQYLQNQLTEFMGESIAAKHRGDMPTYKMYTQLCRLITIQIQAEDRTLNTPLRIHKAWEDFENIGKEIREIKPEFNAKALEENFTKILLYGLLSTIRMHYASHEIEKPSVLLHGIDVEKLSLNEPNRISKYIDPITLELIEYPICITTKSNNHVHHYYYDLHTIYRMVVLIAFPENVSIEDLNGRSLKELDNLLFKGFFDSPELQSYAQYLPNVMTDLINPLTREKLAPSSINFVSEDYLVDLRELRNKYTEANSDAIEQNPSTRQMRP